MALLDVLVTQFTVTISQVFPSCSTRTLTHRAFAKYPISQCEIGLVMSIIVTSIDVFVPPTRMARFAHLAYVVID